MSDRFELFLTCPKGLEALLAEEAAALGLEEVREHTSAIRGFADMQTAYRLCLWSRLANRVLLVLTRFTMRDADELYDGVSDIDWHEHLLPTGSLAVEFSGQGSGIDNTHFGALKVKDAIVDKLRNAAGDRPSIDKLNPDMRVHLRLDRGEAVLSLDLSGHSLHQRGYRLQRRF
jgi:23S rRNA (guanine2445-N2)-methyltransferase / 23S rRNA (guanine2069-N7)-methyltransferase